MTTEESILSALRTFARIRDTGSDCIIVKRTDHPDISGDYFYAIRPNEKHAWTPGETTIPPIDLWYAAGCPPHGKERA